MGYLAFGGFKKLALLVTPDELAHALEGARWCMRHESRPDAQRWPRPFVQLLATYARTLDLPGPAVDEALPDDGGTFLVLTATEGGWKVRLKQAGKRGREVPHTLFKLATPPLHLQTVRLDPAPLWGCEGAAPIPLGLAFSQPRRYRDALDYDVVDIRTYDFEAEPPDARPVREVADTPDGRLWAQLERWTRAHTRPLSVRGPGRAQALGVRISDAMRPWLRERLAAAGAPHVLVGNARGTAAAR